MQNDATHVLTSEIRRSRTRILYEATVKMNFQMILEPVGA